MKTLAPLLTLLVALSLWSQSAPARPVTLKFQTADATNLLWMIDQMSRWDPATTSPSYRTYWEKKLGLTDEDFDMLDRYARIRRRLAGATNDANSGGLDLLGGGSTTAAEQYFLAFLEIPGLKAAMNTLPITAKDKDTLFSVIRHFGKKIGTQGNWKQETAHLKQFEIQVGVLASLADASGFLTQVKTFLGVTEMPAQITVDALWAPPGSTDTRPALVGFHVILPLPIEAVQSDEAVVKQMAVSVGEAVRYMIGRLPDVERRNISQRILGRSGLVNPSRPRLLLDALATACGQVLFLKERFPELAAGATIAPFEPALPYPYAVDEFARALIPDLKTFLPTPGAFMGGFLDNALNKADQLFPPRFSALAATAVVLGSKLPLDLFSGTFIGTAQMRHDLGDVSGFVQTLKKTRRPSVILVRTKEVGQLNLALKKLGLRGKQLPKLRKYRKTSVIYPVKVGKGYGPMVLIVARRDDDFRKAMVELHRMPGLPTKPLIVSSDGVK